MTALPWPDHLVTLDEWKALPEDNRFRVEVVEGILIVSPRPLSFHQRAVSRMGVLLDEQLPRLLAAFAEVEVVIAEKPLPTVRIPDVVVVDSAFADSNPARYPADTVHLAVEMLSGGTVRTDRVMKFAEYAEAGIEQYWIVDLDAPVTLTRYLLIDGAYELFGEHTGVMTVDVADAPVSIDLDALVTREHQKPQS